MWIPVSQLVKDWVSQSVVTWLRTMDSAQLPVVPEPRCKATQVSPGPLMPLLLLTHRPCWPGVKFCVLVPQWSTSLSIHLLWVPLLLYLWEFFIYSRYNSFYGCMIWKYFIPMYGLFFILLRSSFNHILVSYLRNFCQPQGHKYFLLQWRLANFFWNGPDRKYLWLCRPYTISIACWSLSVFFLLQCFKKCSIILSSWGIQKRAGARLGHRTKVCCLLF